MRNQAPQRREDDLKARHNPRVHSILSKKTLIGRRSGGFSLIELLVVISIIGLVLAIGTGVAIKMTTEARKEQTRAIMNGLLAANDEYKAVTQGQDIAQSGPVPGTIFTVGGTERYIAICSQIKSCDEIVKSAVLSASTESNERTFRDGNNNGFKSVYDRWGNAIEYRTFNDQTGALSASPFNDGTRVLNSLLPLSRSPFFASAGPDAEWGTEDDITTLQK